MKKIVFMMACAALTLSSCSQDEVVGVNNGNKADNLITFRTRTPLIPRSQEFTTGNLSEFMVYGFKGYPEDNYEAQKPMDPFFENGPVLFSDNGSGIFTSETPYYYPIDGSSLYFVAYAPATLQVEPTGDYGGVKIENYTIKSDIEEQEDIIFENGAGHLDYNEGDMELTFKHALTKVFISKLGNSGNPYRYEIMGVRFGNINNTGTYLYRGIKSIEPETDENGTFDSEGYLCDYEGNGHFWKTVGEQTDVIEMIFDEPIILDNEHSSIEFMSGNADDPKGSFMMIPQQLSSTAVNNGSMEQGAFTNDMSYIAFLVRITNTDKEFTNTNEDGEEITEECVVYPYDEGVESISRTFGEGDNAVTYAWAAFPVSSLWVPGSYIDYFVDFSKGAGFVAPGADASVEFKPILNHEIRFIESVGEWRDGSKDTIDQENQLGMDEGNVDDPFGD